MYFLQKLCRICVQTGSPLVDIETVDFDLVRLSEKLKICANLALSKDTFSTEICEKCVNKLRVSYHFLNMCKKSTNTIQGYLNKLAGTETCFENSQLNVEIEKLLPELSYSDTDVDLNKNFNLLKNGASRKKHRITKEQRCSLLKQLLNKPKKERDKFNQTYDYWKGGLKSIIDFTENYEFSFNLDKNCNIESTPLDKLTAFSTNYFRRDFTEFKTHILHVIESRDVLERDGSEQDEEFMSEVDSEEESECRFEEIMIEPDIKIKSEDEDSQCPLDYLETSFEDDETNTKVKTELCWDSDADTAPATVSDMSNLPHNIVCIKQEPLTSSPPQGSDFHLTPLDYKSSFSINSSPAVKLLDRLVSSYPLTSRKVFSSSNVRCRTRDQPYINPLLKNQFLYRSFKCERCNRYFKSQGYLKAHTSKVH